MKTIIMLLSVVVLSVPICVTAQELSHITVIPETYRQVAIGAYLSLPEALQNVLKAGKIEIIFKDGEAFGGAIGSDVMGLELDVESVYIRWPAGVETVLFPWGEIRRIDAARHELAHLGLERVFRHDSRIWTELIKALKEEGPEFLQMVSAGHKDAKDLFSSSPMASYQSLQEYMASLIEHGGKPVRMPLPSGRARPMVESLVCNNICTK